VEAPDYWAHTAYAMTSHVDEASQTMQEQVQVVVDEG
jgi:hypothetical protein